MTVHHDDVPLADRANVADPADLAEQERDLDGGPAPEPGDSLPEARVVVARDDAAEADVLEQAQVVDGGDDDYPFVTGAADEE